VGGGGIKPLAERRAQKKDWKWVDTDFAIYKEKFRGGKEEPRRLLGVFWVVRGKGKDCATNTSEHTRSQGDVRQENQKRA